MSSKLCKELNTILRNSCLKHAELAREWVTSILRKAAVDQSNSVKISFKRNNQYSEIGSNMLVTPPNVVDKLAELLSDDGLYVKRIDKTDNIVLEISWTINA